MRRSAAAAAILPLLLALLLLAITTGEAEAKQRTRGRHYHHTVEAPSTAGVVGAAMGRLEAMGVEAEDETSRLQSTWVGCVCWSCVCEREEVSESSIPAFTTPFPGLNVSSTYTNSPNPPRAVPPGRLLAQGGALRHPGVRGHDRRATVLRQYHQDVLSAHGGGGE